MYNGLISLIDTGNDLLKYTLFVSFQYITNNYLTKIAILSILLITNLN